MPPTRATIFWIVGVMNGVRAVPIAASTGKALIMLRPRSGQPYIDGTWKWTVDATARTEAALPAAPHRVENWQDPYQCYGNVRTNITDQMPNNKTDILSYSWQPTHCRLSPFRWILSKELPSAVDKLGPILLVGDSLLQQLWVAMQHLYHASLLQNMHYQKGFLLVNSYTLRPMGVAALNKCRIGAPRISQEVEMASYEPCPIPTLQRNDGAPKIFSGYHQQLDSLKWTATLQNAGAQTVVLNSGHHFYKEHHFGTQACGHPLSEAFRFNADGHRDCPVFDVQYRLMANNVARYLATVASVRWVVLVTSPPGVRDCKSYHHPQPLTYTDNEEDTFTGETSRKLRLLGKAPLQRMRPRSRSRCSM